jgi:hypothetical protein
MAKNLLKSLAKEPGVESPLPSAGKPNASVLRQIAADAGRSMPPAVVRASRRTVLINVKVDEALAIALAERAQAEGVTQKQVIMRALAAAGLPVNPLDLEDRTPRRRRVA